MRILLLLMFTFAAQMSMAQQRVTGTLKTSEGAPISHASVTIRNAANRIVAFMPTDADGNFSIEILTNVRSDSMRLQINHLGYAKIDIPLVLNQSHYELVLEPKAIDLSEITVRNRPRINLDGDTLSYDVGSFSRAEDRSIGDVLSRMPGMEVSESGEIKFNGKTISNFYIDGDDLLQDRYSIGTKTIPHGMVQKLEVLQHHQPLKVLRNRTLSDKVAINLVIKDEAKLKMTGQAKLGAGLPQQYDAELNSILFNKKYKMLNVLKGNNIGHDLSSDFTFLNLNNTLSGLGNSRPQSLLSAGTAGAPSLPKSRYYLNHSGALNANNLINLPSGLQLKTNISGLLDQNDFSYESRTDLYVGEDTIRYRELQDSRRNPFLTDISLTATKNKDHYYLNNTLKLAFSGQEDQAFLQSNEILMDQRLTSRVRDFSNSLEYVPQLKNKHIMSLNGYVNHYNRPEQLRIKPGILPVLLNEGEDYFLLDQWAQTPTWFSTVRAGYRIPSGLIMQNYRIGMLYENQQLHSTLRLRQENGDLTSFSGSGDNHLVWHRKETFADGNYEYKSGRIEASLSLPLTLQQISYKDAGFDLDESDLRVLFSPRFSLKYKTTIEDYLSLNYAYQNQTGNIGGVYRGVVLKNYRNLGANEAALEERSSHQWGLNYHFQRAIQMLFMNAGIAYSKSMANTIASSAVTEDISRIVLLPFDNNVSSISANAGLSKYIFGLGATASLKTSWSETRVNQFVNEQALPYINRSFTLNPSVETTLFRKVSVNYNAVGNWMGSRLSGEVLDRVKESRKVQHYQQNIGLSYSPWRSVFLRVSARHQYSIQPGMQDVQYYFVDAFLRKKVTKWNTDVELNLTNLADVRTFETYGLTANQFFHARYQLRGRMAVFKVIFNL